MCGPRDVKTDTPVRFAGFNLGNFQSVTVAATPYTINIYANRHLESALAPRSGASGTRSQGRNPFPIGGARLSIRRLPTPPELPWPRSGCPRSNTSPRM